MLLTVDIMVKQVYLPCIYACVYARSVSHFQLQVCALLPLLRPTKEA